MNGPVAQPGRASALQAGGLGFKTSKTSELPDGSIQSLKKKLIKKQEICFDKTFPKSFHDHK